MRRYSTSGFGLIEVIVALLILVVGVLGAFAMQASALRGTRDATIDQQLANIAESEIQLQREFDRVVTSTVPTETCRSDFDGDLYGCSVAVHPCTLSAGAITCTSGSATDVIARQIVVSVTGPDNRTSTVSTVVK